MKPFKATLKTVLNLSDTEVVDDLRVSAYTYTDDFQVVTLISDITPNDTTDKETSSSAAFRLDQIIEVEDGKADVCDLDGIVYRIKFCIHRPVLASDVPSNLQLD